MPVVRVKVPTLKSAEVGESLKGIVKRIRGVTDVKVDVDAHNLHVTYTGGVDGTTITAMEKALDLANHPRATFAAGQKRRGFV